MSTQSPSNNVIQTATVAIFSHSRQQSLFVPISKLGIVNSAGGKVMIGENPFEASIREAKEETKKILDNSFGSFLMEGNEPRVIETDFKFQNGPCATDFLYFFFLNRRRSLSSRFQLWLSEQLKLNDPKKSPFWLPRDFIANNSSIIIRGIRYEIFPSNIREFFRNEFLKVMK